MKKLLLATLLMGLTLGLLAQTPISGVFTEDSTLSIAHSPYVVTANITIPDTVTLTVEDNVVIQFNSSRSLTIYGELIADNATFTSSGGSSPGSWGYVYFGNSSYSASATITNCVFEYAYGMVITNGTINMNGSTIENFYYNGVECYDTLNMASSFINLPTFSSSYGYGVFAGANSVVDLDAVNISGCRYSIYISDPTSKVAISNNSVISGAQYNAIQNYGDLTISNTDISATNNSYSAIYCYSNSIANLSNINIGQCGYGIRTQSNSTVTIDNSTIVGAYNYAIYADGDITASNIDIDMISYPNGGNGFYAGSNSVCDLDHINITNCSYGINSTVNTTLTVDTATITNVYYYGVYTSGTTTLNHADIDMTGYNTTNDDYGYGIYCLGGTLTADNIEVVNGNTGLAFNNDYGTPEVSLSNANLTQNIWPVRYKNEAKLSLSGTNNFTGNDWEAFYVQFTSLYDTITFPSINMPYWFSSSFTVQAAGKLTIGSNNILKSNGLNVYGTLIANANPGEFVYFTSRYDDNWGGDTNNDGPATAPAPGNWSGVMFYDSSNDQECILDDCKIRYANYGVYTNHASPVINNCDFSFNNYGAYFYRDSDPVFTNNIIGSSLQVPIAISFEADPVFLDNEFSFSDNEYDAIGLIGGTMTNDAVIKKRNVTGIPNVTYLMLNNITVPDTMTLTIEKGVVIKAIKYYTGNSWNYRNIIVNGTLIANGAPDSLIVFTSVKDDNHGNPNDTNKDGTATYPAKGDWGGIIFAPGSSSNSLMNYCVVNYAQINGASSYYSQSVNSYAISIINANPTISNCEIKDVNYGIGCFQVSDPVLLDNEIINATYTPVAISSTSNPVFSGNVFTNTGWTGLGLIGGTMSISGTIQQRDVAGYTNITYVMLGSITVDGGTYLDIEPGVVIKGGGFYVNGGFQVIGTETDRIVITSINDDNYGNPTDTNNDGASSTPSPGQGGAIVFYETSDDSYCKLENFDYLFPSGITCENANPEIYKANILYVSSTGVQCNGTASPTLHNLVISGWGTNSGQYGIVCNASAAPIVDTVTIQNMNYSYSGNGLYCAGTSSPEFNFVSIENCRQDPIVMSLLSTPTFNDISFIANGSSGIRLLEGTLATDAYLPQRSIAGITNIAYIINEININQNVTLTVEPGVVIKVQGRAPNSYYLYDHIDIRGTLICEGEENNKIVLTSIKDDSAGGDTNNDGNGSAPAPGDWEGLRYYSTATNPANILKYCEIRYAGSDPRNYEEPWDSYYPYGAIKILNVNPVIDSCNIELSSSTAFGIHGTASPVVSNNNIYNINGYPIYMDMFSEPVFSNNAVLNVGGMALQIRNQNYTVSDTIPQRNFAGYNNITYYGGGGTIEFGTTLTIPEGLIFKEANFIVKGKINVLGTESEPVVFTRLEDDDYGNPTDTQFNGYTIPSPSGTCFNFYDESDDASLINNAILRYKTTGVQMTSASPQIVNVDFEHFSNSNNTSGQGLYLLGVSNPSLDSCTFNDTHIPFTTSILSYPSSTINNVIAGNTWKAIQINSETLTQDVTLSKRNYAGINNIPYIFSSYTIGTSATLTIDPGVVIKFTTNGAINVYKGFIAVGGANPDSTIVFTSYRDDFYGGDTNADSTASSPSNVDWRGINFYNESLDPLCQLNHCVFKHAGYSHTYEQNRLGAIKTISASPTIQYCSFTNNFYGIVLSGASNPPVNHCDFDNITYKAINNLDQTFTINAEYNWWGDNSGPEHSGNPGGTGQEVSDGVDYIPWLTEGTANPVMGDVSMNGQIQAYDASLILFYVVDPVSHPLNGTQQLVAETSGNGTITSYDAALILQYIVGIIDFFPAEMENVASPKIPEANLIVGGATAFTGDEFTIPVSIADVSETFSLQTVLSFDNTLLEVVGVETTVAQMSSNTGFDNESGKIKLAFAGTEALYENMTITNITFRVLGNVQGTTITSVVADEFLANETDLTNNSVSGLVELSGFATGIEDMETESELTLFQSYPNPFSESTVINFTINSENINVRIDIYNIQGQIINTLVNGNFSNGSHTIEWKGNDESGKRLDKGIYFMRIAAGQAIQTQKLQILR